MILWGVEGGGWQTTFCRSLESNVCLELHFVGEIITDHDQILMHNNSIIYTKHNCCRRKNSRHSFGWFIQIIKIWSNETDHRLGKQSVGGAYRILALPNDRGCLRPSKYVGLPSCRKPVIFRWPWDTADFWEYSRVASYSGCGVFATVPMKFAQQGESLIWVKYYLRHRLH